MSEALEKLTSEMLDCEACSLSSSRTQVVPGIYGPSNGICFIGEAPGYNEDLKGEPFIGRSGKLLDKMLENIGLKRKQDISILNIVKCRPTKKDGSNRTPTISELRFCGERWLNKQLSYLKPKLIITLGGIALKFFISNASVTKLAGKTINVSDYCPIFVTYHPAYILRNYNMLENYENHFEQIKMLLAEISKDNKFNTLQPKRKKIIKSEQKALTDYVKKTSEFQ